jgi:proline racemase/trans-L-3-hydroxyproline dehydratase
MRVQLELVLSVIDSHTAGEPTRIFSGGLPRLHGNTMLEKMLYMQRHYDWIRTSTMMEPRGHREMVGAVLTEPTHPEAHVGVFYIDCGYYAPMCGAGALAVGKVLVETGRVPAVEPVTTVVQETPAGLVKTYVEVRDGEVLSVSLENVPSFLYRQNIPLEVPEIGRITVDIAWGGNFFVMVDIEQVAAGIDALPVHRLARLGTAILQVAREQVKVQHPLAPQITFLNDLMFCQQPDKPGAPYRGFVVFGNTQVDRSPCGTGTCARMARHYARGELKLNETFVHQSPAKTLFYGKLIKEVKVGDFTAVVPVIQGEVFITGFNQLVIDRRDPLKKGFLLD